MIVIAQQNDTIDLLCWRHLGTTIGVTEQVLALNPYLIDNPILKMGTLVRLPDTHMSTKKMMNLWD